MSELIAYKLISIIISLGFLVTAWLCKKITSTWVNPSSILNLFWFLYTFLPLILAYKTPINPLAIMYIFVFCMLFSVSLILFNWKTALKLNKDKQPAYVWFGNRLFSISFYTISVTTSIFFLIGMVMQGFSFQEMLNPVALAGEFANMRYSAEVKPNIFSQAGLQGSYITIVLGGLYYGATKTDTRKNVLIIILSFLPSILAMTLQSAKGLFFFSVFVFYAGVLVAGIYNQKYQLLTISTLKKFGIFGLFAFPLLVSSFVSRGLQGAEVEIIVEKIRFYLVTYSSGHLFAFSDWLSVRYFNYGSLDYRQESLSGGFYTFMSLFRLFGDDREIPMGVYDEFYTYGKYVKTNIYTVFRGLITDFTILGSLFFALAAGFISNLFFYRLLCSKANIFYILFFIFFVGVSYQSYIISTFMWITIPFVFLVNLIIIFCIRLLQTSVRVV